MSTVVRATPSSLFRTLGPALVVSMLVTTACSSSSPSSQAAPTTRETIPPTTCPAVDGSSERRTLFAAPPPQCIDPATSYSATVRTSRGEFTIELDQTSAPVAVNNFVVLSRYHFYDGLTFTRAIKGWAVGAGALPPPGRDDPGYRFADELPPSRDAYARGTVMMDNDGPDSNGSKFLVMSQTQGVAPKFSVLGTVSEGMATIDAIDATGTDGGTPSEPTTIESITIRES